MKVEKIRAYADLAFSSTTGESEALRSAVAMLDKIRHRIDRAFAEDADKYEADKHAALEDIERIMDGEL